MRVLREEADIGYCSKHQVISLFLLLDMLFNLRVIGLALLPLLALTAAAPNASGKDDTTVHESILRPPPGVTIIKDNGTSPNLDRVDDPDVACFERDGVSANFLLDSLKYY